MRRNFLIMLGGGAAAQIITLVSLPVLGRFYSPESFGYLAVAMSIASICASVLHGRYHMAISVAKKPEDAPVLLVLALLLALVLVVPVVFLAMTITGGGWADLDRWKYVAACLILALGVSWLDIASYWFSYRDRFASIARLQTSRVFLTVVLQLGASWISLYGMVIGALSGLAGAMTIAGTDMMRKDRASLKWPGWQRLRAAAIEYRSYPLFGTPQGLLAASAWNLLPFLLLHTGGAGQVGYFWVAYRLLVAPVTLFNSSYRQVVLREFGKLDQAKGLSLLRKHCAGLALATIFPVVFFMLYGELFFSLLMGDDWSGAGHMASMLAFAIAADLFKAPVICWLQSRHQQKRLLKWEVTVFLLRYSFAGIGAVFGTADMVIGGFAAGSFLGWSSFALFHCLKAERTSGDHS